MITKIELEELKDLLVELESHQKIPEYEKEEILELLEKVYGKSNFHKIICYHTSEYDDSNYDYSIQRIEVFNIEGVEVVKLNVKTEDEDTRPSIWNSDYYWDSDYSRLLNMLNNISPWYQEDVGKEIKNGKGILTFYFDDVPQLKIPNFYIDYNT